MAAASGYSLACRFWEYGLGFIRDSGFKIFVSDKDLCGHCNDTTFERSHPS